MRKGVDSTERIHLSASDGSRLSEMLRLAIAACFCVGLALWAQTSDSQTADGNKSWTATSESQSDRINPTRTTESHSQSGNRTVDKQSVQRRGLDGHFEPFQDIEKESVQVNAATVRTVTRTFGWANGVRTLVQVTEEESQGLPGEDSKVVRATSSPDVNGNLQLVQRESEETKKTGKDADETKTTVMRPNRMGARQEVEFGGWPRFAPRFWALTLRFAQGRLWYQECPVPRCRRLVTRSRAVHSDSISTTPFSRSA